jgi:mRNA interferase MazF
MYVEEVRMNSIAQRYLRGQVWYVCNRKPEGGSIQEGDRPFLIVSNDRGNGTANFIVGVAFTTQKKKYLPTHVVIEVDGEEQTILCEQVRSLPTEALGNYQYTLSDKVMERVGEALSIALGLAPITYPPAEVLRSDPDPAVRMEIAWPAEPEVSPELPAEEEVDTATTRMTIEEAVTYLFRSAEGYTATEIYQHIGQHIHKTTPAVVRVIIGNMVQRGLLVCQNRKYFKGNAFGPYKPHHA